LHRYIAWVADEKKAGEVTEWEEVWNEVTPGMEAGIRLHLSEITEMLTELIDHAAWSTKTQAARAMATVAERLGSGLGQPQLGQLLEALLAALSSRTWTGKAGSSLSSRQYQFIPKTWKIHLLQAFKIKITTIKRDEF
jgi:proteasome component ECM29